MATEPKQGEEQPDASRQASPSQYDRLERLAAVATQAAQAKQWRAHKNGMASQDEPSEVRNMNHDEEARAQAEAAMQQMMAKSGSKQRRR